MDASDQPNTDAGATASGGQAWAATPRTLLLVAGAAFALLGLLALASSIDWPTLNPDPVADRAQDAEQGSGSGSSGSGSSGSGSGSGSGQLDLGGGVFLDLDGGDVQVREIPGCPDGFSIGEDILVIPDPEACGFRAVEPGDQNFNPNGKIILVPDSEGDIAGLRLDSNGRLAPVPTGELGIGDYVLGQEADGSFSLIAPDGSRVEITPDEDGVRVEDPDGELRGVEPPAAEESDDSGDSNSSDLSALGPLLFLVLASGALALLVYLLTQAFSNRSPRTTGTPEAPVDGPLEVVDYSTEINALDRLLWEIDQEADPRRAIRRVYAALETGLDNPEMARRAWETPGIYLHRILGRFDELEGPLQELTFLFEQARFSEHEITNEMRDRAVSTLVAVRAHYAYVTAQAIAETETRDTMELAAP